MHNLFRHGDLLIQAVDKLPDAQERLSHGILAHGELTGHCHRVLEIDRIRLFRSGDSLYLEITPGPTVSVTHEEHAPIPLPPGSYRVWRQREYSPEAIRVVRD